MLPLSDGIPARRFPVVNVLLIIANFAVFILYELPHLNAAVYHASFYPCTVDGACRGPLPWGLSWITAMFLHGGCDPGAASPSSPTSAGSSSACWQHGCWPGRHRPHPRSSGAPRPSAGDRGADRSRIRYSHY
jgi:hypothetical protein